ncbi:MAG TPA: protein phosphatase CheZ [Rhodocyclaceae bacterium]
MPEMTSMGDSDELQALFDSVAASSGTPAPAPAPAISPSGDSDDLQALFDSIAGEAGQPSAAPGAPAAAGAANSSQAFNRVGQMARQLHDMLRGLGYDKLLSKTVEAIPDATDRLAYVATLTEQAACRVLNATDVAMPVQDSLGAAGSGLAARWDRLYANELSVDEFRALADETRAFLKGQVPESVSATNAQLMEIMMAQDFQDLTGQVIKKVVTLAQDLEKQMMALLIDIIPDERRTEAVSSLLNGPIINPAGRTDVVSNQAQVDDLLDSLGF